MTSKKIGDYVMNQSKCLGSGMFSDTYLSHRKNEPDAQFAIKVIKKSKYQEFDKLEKLIRQERDLLDLLNHPNIVKLHDTYMTANNIYLVLEYCNQGTLEKYRNDAIVPEAKVLEILYQIATGMNYASTKKVIHRDIKPDNILLNDGIVKIADFGFSRLNSENTNKLTSGIGTPSYMAPEVYKGEDNYDWKCDVWSTGIMIYELLYNKLPWIGKSDYDLFINNIQKKPLKFPKNIEVSEELKSIISNMLKIPREERIGWEDILKNNILKTAKKKFDNYGKEKKKFNAATHKEKTIFYFMIVKFFNNTIQGIIENWDILNGNKFLYHILFILYKYELFLLKKLKKIISKFREVIKIDQIKDTTDKLFKDEMINFDILYSEIETNQKDLISEKSKFKKFFNKDEIFDTENFSIFFRYFRDDYSKLFSTDSKQIIEGKLFQNSSLKSVYDILLCSEILDLSNLYKDQNFKKDLFLNNKIFDRKELYSNIKKEMISEIGDSESDSEKNKKYK